jgi:hypothetical protein
METKFNSGIGKVGCHMENVAELLQDFDNEYITVDGEVIKLSGEVALTLMGDLFRKFQETVRECEGKVIEVEFGDSPTANLLEQLVEFILKASEGKEKE